MWVRWYNEKNPALSSEEGMPNARCVGLAIGCAVLMTLACASLGSPSTLPVGESAPNFGVQLGDQTVTLEGLRGRVVVTNFWSST